jgi:hypothetical protein
MKLKARTALRPHDAAWRQLAGTPSGRLLAAGALMLLLAAAAAAVLAPHWRSEAAAWRQTALALAPASAPVAVAWPPATDHAQRVRALLGLAQQHGLVVRSLREEAGAAAVVVRQDSGPRWRAVQLSAEGGYGELRAFVAEALAADPALALDSLVLQGGEGAVAPLRAEFGWSLASASIVSGPAP